MVFVNASACDLYAWGLKINNRIKASEICGVALAMENKYRDYYGCIGVRYVPSAQKPPLP